ncbi:hypothetical protein, partial [Streptomyces afghaniensis]|uniref:hypothetical protein n=1 Tax=Streptomyces afghaniensis TaxID=66865 RepID=UPI000569CFD3
SSPDVPRLARFSPAGLDSSVITAFAAQQLGERGEDGAQLQRGLPNQEENFKAIDLAPPGTPRTRTRWPST